MLLYSCKTQKDEENIQRILGKAPKKLKNPQIDVQVYKMFSKLRDPKTQKVELRHSFDLPKT